MNDFRIIDLKECVKLTSLSRTMLNRYRADGRFPRAVPLGEKRIGFVASEVREWIDARIRERDRGQSP